MPNPSTFEELQEQDSSAKIGLATFEVARRASDWSVHSGSIYRAGNYPTVDKVVSVSSDGVALTLAASVGAMSAGKYFWDHDENVLYVWLTAGADPNTKTIAVIDKLFFATEPVRAPHDLATGYDVEWLPFLDNTSEFLFEVENSRSLLGVAISNSSGIKLANVLEYWESVYDNVAFEGHLVTAYIWSRLLPVTEALLLYKGRVSKRTFEDGAVSFEVRDFLDELRAPVNIVDMSEYVGAVIPSSLNTPKIGRAHV